MMNTTEDRLNAIKEEMRAMRLMVMQHRYVLDLMTAMEGGVCTKIGTACCTFIPRITWTTGLSQLPAKYCTIYTEQ